MRKDIIRYRVECCNKVLPYNLVYGVLNRPDMFDRKFEFTICKPHEAERHCCIDCYGKHAIQAAGLLMSGDNSSIERQLIIRPFANKFLRRVYFDKFYPKKLHR